ncbi:hypothetical protein BC826DRAFT_960018 [Russula brevipes]|nr:hypothetical protein BC826DRAFT_960018 [Russula brevipes]
MGYCDRCARRFPDDCALELHIKHSNSHWLCHDCDLDFESLGALQQHVDAKHRYCLTHRVFGSKASLRFHYGQRLGHHFCFKCGEEFDDADDLKGHFEEDHHSCLQCYELFDDYKDLQEHDRDVHTYCTDCQRGFQSESNLSHHLRSKRHQPCNVHCPGRGCFKSFVSAAALTLHFESDTCPSGMTREQLNRIVVRADTNNYITNPARLLTGPLGRFEPPPAPVTWATERSWNEDAGAYECFLCNSTFGTLVRLNQHLKSLRHEEEIYKCPKSDCQKEFVTLGGLCQHVESGSCGVRMFTQVRNMMDDLTRGFNVLTM